MFSQAAKSAAKSVKRQKYINRDFPKITKNLRAKLSKILRHSSKEFVLNKASNLKVAEVAKNWVDTKNPLLDKKHLTSIKAIAKQEGDESSINGGYQNAQVLGEMGPITKRFWQGDCTPTQMLNWLSENSRFSTISSFKNKRSSTSVRSIAKARQENMTKTNLNIRNDAKNLSYANNADSKALLSLVNAIKQSLCRKRSNVLKVSSKSLNTQEARPSMFQKISQSKMKKSMKCATREVAKNVQFRPKASSEKSKNWTVPPMISDRKPLLLHDFNAAKNKSRIRPNNSLMGSDILDVSAPSAEKKKLKHISLRMPELRERNLSQSHRLDMSRNNSSKTVSSPSQQSNVAIIGGEDAEIIYQNKCFCPTLNEGVPEGKTSSYSHTLEDCSKASDPKVTNAEMADLQNDSSKINLVKKLSYQSNELLSKIKIKEFVESNTSVLSSSGLENLFYPKSLEPAFVGVLPINNIHTRRGLPLSRDIHSGINLYNKDKDKDKDKEKDIANKSCFEKIKQFCSKNKPDEPRTVCDDAEEHPCKKDPCKHDEKKCLPDCSYSCKPRKSMDPCCSIRKLRLCKDYKPKYKCQEPPDPCRLIKRGRLCKKEVKCEDPCERIKKTKSCKAFVEYITIPRIEEDPCKKCRLKLACKPKDILCPKDSDPLTETCPPVLEKELDTDSSAAKKCPPCPKKPPLKGIFQETHTPKCACEEEKPTKAQPCCPDATNVPNPKCPSPGTNTNNTPNTTNSTTIRPYSTYATLRPGNNFLYYDYLKFQQKHQDVKLIPTNKFGTAANLARDTKSKLQSGKSVKTVGVLDTFGVLSEENL